MLLASACVALSACVRMGESSIKMPANPVLTGGLGWGLVKDSYVRLKERPDASARDLDHLRRGAVYELGARVLGAAEGATVKPDPEAPPVLWYGISSEGTSGWIRGAEMEVYASQAQAERAAAAYR
jgi:hypothetical protein